MRELPARQRKLGERAEECYRLELVGQQRAGRIKFHCRPEWFVWPTQGVPFLCEVKGQELYLAPPFDGHGLPAQQAERYMELFRSLGLRTWFVVYDPTTLMRYEAWLDDLEARGSDYCFTTSVSGRRIYELSGFTATTLPAREAVA